MSNRIYVGNLPLNIRESEIDDLFYKYGRIRHIELKTPSRPPAFAFVSYDDSRDADDAVRARDGYSFDGYRLRVELAKGGRDRDDRDHRDRRDARDRDDRPKKTGGRRTEYGVLISNLPRGCSWQDLKDFMRKAGDVVYTDCDRDGEGVVEFSNRQDMEHAVRTLNDTEFKNFNESSVIRVKFANKQHSASSNDDDHKPREGSRSRSRSPVDRKRSPRSHSRSPSGERRETAANADN